MTVLRQDSMTKDERMIALLNRQPLDRVPVWGFSIGFPAVNVGYAISDMYSDPQKAFDAMTWTTEQYGLQDIPWISWPMMGRGRIKMPDSEFSQSPSITSYRVTTEEDAWGIRLPDATREGGQPTMECARLVMESGGPFVILAVGVFTSAATFCGTEQLCRWMIRKPAAAHRLLRLAADQAVARVRYWADTFGPEHVLPMAGEPTVSNQIISPRHFQEFALPYIKETHERILAMGVRHILCHICGEQNLNLPYWAQVPMGNPGIVSFGHEIDLDVASKHFPNDILMGNVETGIIQTGTPDEVYESTRVCIEKGRRHPGGFMLSPGCEMPPRVPPYNVWTMMKAVNDFGRYE